MKINKIQSQLKIEGVFKTYIASVNIPQKLIDIQGCDSWIYLPWPLSQKIETRKIKLHQNYIITLARQKNLYSGRLFVHSIKSIKRHSLNNKVKNVVRILLNLHNLLLFKKMETTESNETGFHTRNTRILVNWETKKIIHLNDHNESRPFKILLSKGYQYVGLLKPDGRIFWETDFFNPDDKYIKT